jgi:hypothetical protein
MPVPYRLTGSVIHVATDLRSVEKPEPATWSATAWLIVQGVVGDVAISGLTFISVSRRSAGGKVATIVGRLDEGAAPEQVLALLDVFQGRVGGPTRHLAMLAGEWAATYQVLVERRIADEESSIAVPQRLLLRVRQVSGKPDERLSGSLFISFPEQEWTYHTETCSAFRAELAMRNTVSRLDRE